MLAKKYVLLRQNSSGPLGKEIKDKYKIGRNSIALLTPEGEVIARLQNEPSAEDVFSAIDGLPDFRLGMEQLAKLKEKGVTKANADAVAGALRRIGAYPSDESRETILPYVKDDKAPEAVQSAAIRALAKHPAAAADLVPFLTDKRSAFRSAAQTALTGMGVKALPPLLDALGSEDVNVRAAAFGPAAAVTKSGKVSRDLGFWKTGKEEARAKALEDWRAWFDAQQTPKEETKAKK
jgi:HEAT repeat protein